MYAFPRLRLPAKAVTEAEKQGKEADFVYCMKLLDKTGIVTVPGSGFQQEPGTLHVRTTILPPESDMDAVVGRWAEFHSEYMAQYADDAPTNGN
jgi:aspartate/methionine/tyrosine aminotransferase